MANALFTGYKQEALGDAGGPGHGTVDWEGDTIKVILYDNAAGAPNPETWMDLADTAAGDRIATATLGTVAVTMNTGTAKVDAADTTFATVTGDQSESLIVYKDSGVEGTSLLIVYYDTFVSGMPVTPNGGDIIVQWNASGLWTW